MGTRGHKISFVLRFVSLNLFVGWVINIKVKYWACNWLAVTELQWGRWSQWPRVKSSPEESLVTWLKTRINIRRQTSEWIHLDKRCQPICERLSVLCYCQSLLPTWIWSQLANCQMWDVWAGIMKLLSLSGDAGGRNLSCCFNWRPGSASVL